MIQREPTDSELAERARMGDPSAFTLLVERYKNLVFSIVKKYVDDNNEAEEVLQHIFEKAWRNLHMLHSSEAFKSWLCTIATTTTIDAFRNCKKRPFLLSLEDTDEQKVDAEFEEGIAEKEFVHAVLRKLNPKERLCLMLDAQGYTAKEIAEITCGLGDLAIKVNQVNVHLYRGRIKFAKIYLAMMQEIDEKGGK